MYLLKLANEVIVQHACLGNRNCAMRPSLPTLCSLELK